MFKKLTIVGLVVLAAGCGQVAVESSRLDRGAVAAPEAHAAYEVETRAPDQPSASAKVEPAT